MDYCKKCGKCPLVNATECEYCRDKRRNRQNKTYKDKKRVKELIKTGLCGVCGKNPLVNATECISCRDARRERNKRDYNDRKLSGLLAYRLRANNYASKGLCNRCGKNVPDANKKRCKNCLEIQKQRTEKYKKIVFDHYGNFCKCCGENIPKFLTLDHITNDGAAHRKELRSKSRGTGWYLWLINNEFPKNIQVLCWNCNCGKKVNNGICPHKTNEKTNT